MDLRKPAALCGATLVAMCLGVLSAETAGPTARPTSQEHAARRARLDRAVAAIVEAEHPRTAMAAYSRGRAAAGDHLRLHEAYMRRMLTLGLPQFARYGARAVLIYEPNNGTAWAVIGYMHGRGGRALHKALEATVKAAASIPSDPSVQYNAGQLIAWYDHNRNVRGISASTVRAVAAVRGRLASAGPYGLARKAVNDAYAAGEKIKAEYEARIVPVRREADAILTEGRGIDRQLSSLQNSINSYSNSIRDLRRRQRVLASRDSDRHDAYRQQEIRALNDQIRRESLARNRVRSERSVVLRKGRALLARHRARQRDIRKIQRERDAAVRKVAPKFDLRPPAVDGVVTPPVERILRAPGTTTTTAPAGPAPDAADRAESRLKLAVQYLRADMRDKARQVLRDIIKRFEGTPAAHKARVLLDDLD